MTFVADVGHIGLTLDRTIRLCVRSWKIYLRTLVIGVPLLAFADVLSVPGDLSPLAIAFVPLCLYQLIISTLVANDVLAGGGMSMSTVFRRSLRRFVPALIVTTAFAVAAVFVLVCFGAAAAAGISALLFFHLIEIENGIGFLFLIPAGAMFAVGVVLSPWSVGMLSVVIGEAAPLRAIGASIATLRGRRALVRSVVVGGAAMLCVAFTQMIGLIVSGIAQATFMIPWLAAAAFELVAVVGSAPFMLFLAGCAIEEWPMVQGVVSERAAPR